MDKTDSAALRLLTHFDSRLDELLDELFEFLKIPSISSEPEYKGDMLRCADWLEKYLAASGLNVERWETSGHPAIYAAHPNQDPAKPTVLIYGHYDVQPVDPLDLWDSPPFEPVIKDGIIYGRGASDDKGQLFYTICAIKALLSENGKLPLNVKFIIDGEEEAGSLGLAQILDSHRDQLIADYLIAVDSGFDDIEKPEVTLGLRGITLLSVTVTGSDVDLHSGTHGGIAFNANHALVELLAKLRDENGKITVPGFYDQISVLSPDEKEQINFDFDSRKYKNDFGADAAGGEKDYSPLESSGVRPTLEINGITGGYAGDGFKTVIPAQARANLSCRLVPDQDPLRIGELVSEFLKDNAPEGIRVDVNIHPGSGLPLRISPQAHLSQVVAQAYRDVTGLDCGFNLAGGSIPIIPEIMKVSGAEAVMMGYMLNTDNAHAPNEQFGIDRFRLGFATIIRILELLQ